MATKPAVWLVGRDLLLGRVPLIKRNMGLVTRQWERKRFYKNASVYKEIKGNRDLYGVKLDHRSLRTPLRHQFLVPSESLALAVAQEWGSQDKLVQLPLMHLTALCNTVLDGGKARMELAEAGAQGFTVSEEDLEAAVGYIATDTLCFRVTEPDDLVARQEQEWGPLVEWFNTRFHCEVPVTTDHFLAPASPAPPISQAAPQRSSSLSAFLTGMDRWSWTGFKYALDSCSSLILACALYDGHIDSSEASHLARLEVRHQVNRWGEVEWYHSVEEADLNSRLSATVLLQKLSRDIN